jgi:hypothetical protein
MLSFILPAELVTQTIATLIGIFVGTLSALTIDHYTERVRMRRRARSVLRSLAHELRTNYETLEGVQAAYQNTAWGRSFYISTTAWETAISSGDLPDIIGSELTDLVSAQYALFFRIRYYVDLLTRLWFAPSDIQGYDEMRGGFRKAILETITQALKQQSEVAHQMGGL